MWIKYINYNTPRLLSETRAIHCCVGKPRDSLHRPSPNTSFLLATKPSNSNKSSEFFLYQLEHTASTMSPMPRSAIFWLLAITSCCQAEIELYWSNKTIPVLGRIGKPIRSSLQAATLDVNSSIPALGAEVFKSGSAIGPGTLENRGLDVLDTRQTCPPTHPGMFLSDQMIRGQYILTKLHDTSTLCRWQMLSSHLPCLLYRPKRRLLPFEQARLRDQRVLSLGDDPLPQ